MAILRKTIMRSVFFLSGPRLVLFVSRLGSLENLLPVLPNGLYLELFDQQVKDFLN